MTRKHTKLIHEGEYAAEVDVELIEADQGWAPYLSVADVRRLDAVREALRSGDVDSAREEARIFRMVPEG